MHTGSFDVRTDRCEQFIDITQRVERLLRETGVREGLANVFAPHTTAGLTINENADPDVVHDVLAALDQAVPLRASFYQHAEGNSAAHVKSSLVGCSLIVPVHDGRLALGTWQGIYFCEFDGPRTRHVTVSVIGG